MRRILVCLALTAFLFSCNNDKDKDKSAGGTTPSTSTATTPADLPYKADYSGSFNQDVSDADLKTVLNSYKDWEDNNFTNLTKEMGDTVEVDMSSGDHYKKSNAGLMKMWSTYRDSLSSAKINMIAWDKVHSTDKGDSFILTWYDETDTYKNGKVDSATYHDINQVKNGKIVWFSQYKRPKK